MPGTVLLIAVIKIDVLAFKVCTGPAGKKKNLITINQSGESTLVYKMNC